MNFLFKAYLRHFVVVFFDDILIYSSSEEAHLEHVRTVLQCLQSNQFFVKLSKCSFFETTVHYLGHVVGEGRVRADPTKIEAMKD